jgi:hypothetical protein
MNPAPLLRADPDEEPKIHIQVLASSPYYLAMEARNRVTVTSHTSDVTVIFSLDVCCVLTLIWQSDVGTLRHTFTVD